MDAVPRRLCAASDETMHWDSIDWTERTNVKRLQARIVKATEEGRWGKVKALQWLLTHSFSGKALAVKRVTENKGKNTPGVDGETWSTGDERQSDGVTEAEGVSSLNRYGGSIIPKANGKRRPLGIPTMKDRAMQALYLLALDPVSETKADRNSYGFRNAR